MSWFYGVELGLKSILWEDIAVLLEAFPNLNLEDKGNPKGEGSVTKQKRTNESSSGRKVEKHVGEKVMDHKGGLRPKITNSKLKDFHWLVE